MVKGLKGVAVTDWVGTDTFTDPEETPPEAFVDALNVVITPSGNIAALRSPANFNTALAFSNPVLSAFDYDRVVAGASQPAIIFDINTSSGTNVRTYATSVGAVNTVVRSGQAAARFQSTNVNNNLYRLNGTEFIQIVPSLGVYAVGITKPAAAPSVSVVAGGTLTMTVGVTASYAYRNATTGHVGECSATSSASGATTSTNGTLRVPTVASTQTGVDGIVLFLTANAGSIRYLVVDANGDPIVYANATANVDITAAFHLNMNVRETAFNAPPTAGATFLFKWRNRNVICGFPTVPNHALLYYSGFDQIEYGVPWECYPPLNALALPNKSEGAKGGIDTPIGALILSEKNAYLLNGTPTDKVDSGENVLQVTEQLQSLGWGLGTFSPLTIQNTPYGTIWLDQNKQLQFWPWQGQAQPLAVGIWEDLATIQDSESILALAEGVWFQTGKNAGFYALTASTTGSTNNRTWIISIVRAPDGLRIRPAASSIAAQTVFTARINGKLRCFIGLTDRLREILDFETQGAGWPDGTEIYADLVAGNQLTNFNRLHSIRVDGTRTQDLLFRASNLNGTESQTLRMNEEGGSYFGLVDRYQTRHRIEIAFPIDDAAKREVKSVRLAHGLKVRVI